MRALTYRPAVSVRASLLAAALLVLFLPNAANAIPLAEYQRNLQRAVTALDTLLQKDEAEGASDYEKRIDQTFNAVRIILPINQLVQLGDDNFDVDNSWLHERLDQIETTGKAADRQRRITHLVEQLEAVEERVGELVKANAVATDKELANRKLAAILARPEYATKGKAASALTRLLRDFIKWLESLFPKQSPLRPGGGAWLIRVAQIVVFVLAFSVLIYVGYSLLRWFGHRKRSIKEDKPRARIVLGERLEPEQSATDLLAEAEELARSGNLRSAIRKAYIALLVELGDRKLISLAQHKTNRDYLRAVSNVPSLHSHMMGLTAVFERHWYGIVQATQNDWQEFRRDYQSTLRGGTS